MMVAYPGTAMPQMSFLQDDDQKDKAARKWRL